MMDKDAYPQLVGEFIKQEFCRTWFVKIGSSADTTFLIRAETAKEAAQRAAREFTRIYPRWEEINLDNYEDHGGPMWDRLFTSIYPMRGPNIHVHTIDYIEG